MLHQCAESISGVLLASEADCCDSLLHLCRFLPLLFATTSDLSQLMRTTHSIVASAAQQMRIQKSHDDPVGIVTGFHNPLVYYRQAARTRKNFLHLHTLLLRNAGAFGSCCAATLDDGSHSVGTLRIPATPPRRPPADAVEVFCAAAARAPGSHASITELPPSPHASAAPPWHLVQGAK